MHLLQKQNWILFGACLVLSFIFFTNTGHTKTDKTYQKKVKKLFQQKKIYNKNDLKAELIWSALPLNQKFQAIKNKTNQTTLKIALKPNYRMLVCVYYHENQYADLNNEKGNWSLILELDGNDYQPAEIQLVKKRSLLEKKLFFFCDQWSQLYYVRFDQLPASYWLHSFNQMKLTLKNPFVESSLVWKN